MSFTILLIAGCGAEPASPPPDVRPLTSTVPTGDPRVAMAQAMGLVLEHPQVEDLWVDRAYRVDLFDEDGDKRADRGLLDVDRDGNAEQRWTRGDGGALMVETSFEDDGVYAPPEPWAGPVPQSELQIDGSHGGAR